MLTISNTSVKLHLRPSSQLFLLGYFSTQVFFWISEKHNENKQHSLWSFWMLFLIPDQVTHMTHFSFSYRESLPIVWYRKGWEVGGQVGRDRYSSKCEYGRGEWEGLYCSALQMNSWSINSFSRLIWRLSNIYPEIGNANFMGALLTFKQQLV